MAGRCLEQLDEPSAADLAFDLADVIGFNEYFGYRRYDTPPRPDTAGATPYGGAPTVRSPSGDHR
ncbi:hypothetical protein AB0D14_30970 [Streptomyces sp. NPDC048484]|uniref:hypothetical protein n=1 Tax=Streptomyces sp. NPDC048484 TaxID=3155146 RepID=UPI0034298260